MAPRIRVLPDSVANQIAAGEVVERPASVVKELVENAIDAGATRIEVRLEQGGRRLILVEDDGWGMGREDALLSLDRHATSKILAADDLRAVRTFGFRGEALPSIASISRMTLETATSEDPYGTRLQVRGGVITQVEDLARTPGTTVRVEQLFFNAPVRARFLRSASVETRAVSDALAPLALAHPGVELRLLSDDRVLLDLQRAREVGERVAALWGEEEARTLVPVAFEGKGLSVQGLIQRPDAVRDGFRRAQLFVGDRPFREASLLRAADRGYRTTVAEGRRPWVLLFLRLPEGSVDVNVHPTKAEVRFRDRGAVEELVERGVRRALEGIASAAPWLDQPPRATLHLRERRPPELSPPQMALFLPAEEWPAPQGEAGSPREGDLDGEPGWEAEPHSEEARRSVEAAGESIGGAYLGEGVSRVSQGEERRAGAPESRPRLWQVHHSWIVAEVRDGILLIDQHAAHERILFETLMRRFDEGGEPSQRLLFPLTLRLAPAELAVVDEMGGLLRQTGFEVEAFGGDTIIVHAVPAPHPHFDAERALREILAELAQGSELTRAARNQYERLAMTFACKAAIKAGQPLSAGEIEELFDRLFGTELPYHDVHGRPTTLRLSRGELERKFGR